MKKILVTGATGFVGKEVCRVLHSRGIPYVAAVRRSTEQNQIEVGELSRATNWSRALEACEVVIHLAARVHVMKDKASNPLSLYREINVAATLNLARQATESGVKRFVFVSSVKVNGEATKDKPFTPSDRPAPIDPYGQSKFEAEQALIALSEQTGIELVIVRPPLVYGPGVRANFLRLMQLVKTGMPLPFKGIQNLRSLVAIDNLVDLLISCTSHPKAAGNIFLVSDDRDLSTIELIKLIARSMKKKPVLLPLPVRFVALCAKAFGKAGAVNRMLGSLQVDITSTKKTLNWRPIVAPEAAIGRTVSHFLQRQ